MSIYGVPARVLAIAIALYTAYDIRLFAIQNYGLVIHEFDPWFNYRATEYLAQHGWKKFFTWYDHRSWYPLGRPVGTTIYPGMQIAAVGIWNTLNYFGIDMSLNDVCCYIPVWFGVAATVLLGFLAKECTGNTDVGIIAAVIMSMIPAHLMRSVGGGFDNESVAITAMMATFFLWTRSLRTRRSWPWAILAGIAYIFMVAAWGGYVFVINMVAAHVGFLVLRGHHSTKLHRAYTLFYVIGTAGATFVPVVGWTPLKSLEQLGAFAVLGMLQVCEAVDMYGRSKKMDEREITLLRMKAFAAAGAGGLVVAFAIAPTGYFGPISSRIRGLFVPHTRTGNPLVDSVAEHQPASAGAYWQYLHYMCWFAPVGFFMLVSEKKHSDARFFMILHTSFAYFFRQDGEAYFAHGSCRVDVRRGEHQRPPPLVLGRSALAGDLVKDAAVEGEKSPSKKGVDLQKAGKERKGGQEKAFFRSRGDPSRHARSPPVRRLLQERSRKSASRNRRRNRRADVDFVCSRLSLLLVPHCRGHVAA